MGRAKWLALAAALLGWMFDGAEMGVFSMVGRPAVKDLLGIPDKGTLIGVSTVSNLASLNGQPWNILGAVAASDTLANSYEKVTALWFGIVIAGFLVGAATGGVLFGWLGDRIGRVWAMALSILTYSVFTGLCGLAAQAWQIGLLRFIAALGMGGEWSLGVALVMEIWPNRSRAFMAGLIGASGNIGYMMVGIIGLGLANWLPQIGQILSGAGLSPERVDWLVRNQGWRLMLLLGTLPALLMFFICLWVPESKRWQEEKGRGATAGWASYDLLGVLGGALGPALMVYLWAWPGPAWLPHTPLVRGLGTGLGLAIATVGYLYPVVRYLQRMGETSNTGRGLRPMLGRLLLAAGLSGVALLGTWASTQWAPTWADQLTQHQKWLQAKEHTQIWLAVGACVGTLLAALMGDWLGRRPTYVLLCLFSLGSVFVFFQGNRNFGVPFLFWCFLAGGCTASFYGWLPLYLPELFPTRVRATGQGFGYNFGRILAAIGALQGGNLVGLFKDNVTLGGITLAGGYPLACSVMSLIYLVGLALIWLGPETRGRPLPE